MKNFKRTFAISWQRLSLLILCVVLALVLFVMLFATAYIQYLLSFITGNDDSDIRGTLSSEQMATATEETDPTLDFTGPSVDPTDVTINTLPSLPPEEMIVEGVYNIMLIGEDRRPGEGRQRSDSMILCSFNTNNNTLTMISFLRDTYVAIPGHNPNKLNAAYQWGGTDLLDQTLALNYGVHVDANVVVNFEGFKSIIDMLGGVSINLTEAEANHLNEKYDWDLSPGVQHLDGKKALAYSRIRKIDWDINRTQRQRNVLTSLINSFKNQSLSSMLPLATNIMQSGYIDTDMSTSELATYITKLFPMLASAKINNQHIPALDTYDEMTIGDLDYCKVPYLDINRQILKQIFTAQ